MKRSDLSNKRVVSALMIGISAMMALQTPITAYANDNTDEVPENNNEPETTQQTEAVVEYQEVTTQAQEQAEVAQDACVEPAAEENNEAQEQAPQESEGTQEELASAATEAAEAANLILEGDATQEVAPAATTDAANATAQVQAVIDAAEQVVNDTTEEDGTVVTAATTDLQAAADNIENVKKDLVAAEDANKQFEEKYTVVEEEAKEATEDFKGITEQAGNMTEVTQEAGQKAAELVDTIQNADTKEDAENAYKDLEKLVSDTKADLETRKALYDRLASEYEDAVKKLDEAQSALEAAEKKFDTKIEDATKKTQEAAADVTAAQQKVDNLADALDLVEDKIEDEVEANKLSSTRGNNWDGKLGNVDKNRAVMKQVIVNYYMPEILGIDILADQVNYDTDFVSLKGVDGQEYNYSKLTYKYKDAEGNIQDGVKYFNWDSLLKLSPSTTNINTGDGMVIFEKSLEEIEANDYIKKYYTEKDSSKLKDGNKWKAYLAGDFDVYTYTDDEGVKHYVVRDEVENPTEGVTIEKNGTTPTSYNGYALTQVIQNKNNLLHDADCLIIGKNEKIDKYTQSNNNTTAVYTQVVNKLDSETVSAVVERSKALNSFITENAQVKHNAAAAMSQYAKYKEATAEAQKAVKNANEQVDKLADAIATVKTQTQNTRKSLKAVDVLGVTDIAGYLGLKVDETEAARLNGLTVSKLLKELNTLKKDADNKVKEAQTKADELQGKLTDASNDLQNTIGRLTPVAVTILEEVIEQTGTSGGTETGGGAATGGTVVAETETETGGGTSTGGGTTTGGTVVAETETETGGGTSTGGGTTTGGAVVAETETETGGGTSTGGGTTTGGTVVAETGTGGGTAIGGGAAISGGTVTTASQRTETATESVATATAAAETVATGGTIEAATETAATSIAVETVETVATNAANPVTAATAIENIGGTNTTGAVALENMTLADAGDTGDGYTVEQSGSDSAGAAEGAIIIEDEGAPLAADANVTHSTQAVQSSQVVVNEEKLVSIEDEKTALAVSAESNTIPQKKSWWWFIIIAILGATGEKMYKDHLNKKKEFDDFEE